jgi:hypothetical protein
MGLLDGTSVYLVGAIDHASDPHKWRRELTNNLLHPLGIKVYDPLVKPSWLDKVYPHIEDDVVSDFLVFKRLLGEPRSIPEEQHEMVWDRMHGIRELCLRYAHDCSFMIVNLPKQFTIGTLEEIGVAADAGKPVFFVLPDGPATSTWFPPQVYDRLEEFHEYTFNSMEELSNHLRAIDSGDVAVDRLRWVFLHYFSDRNVIHEFSNRESIGSQSS